MMSQARSITKKYTYQDCLHWPDEERWEIIPDEELVERFLIENDKYGAPEVFNWDENMRIESLDLDVDFWDIFEKEQEEKEEVPGQT